MARVNNTTYRNTMNDYNNVSARRRQSEQALADARSRLDNLRYEVSRMAEEDKRAYEIALKREADRLFAGLEDASEEFRNELGRINVIMREEIRRTEKEIGILSERTEMLENIAEEQERRISEVDRHVELLDNRVSEVKDEVNDLESYASDIDSKVTDLADDISRRFSELAQRLSNQKDRAVAYMNQLQVIMDRINLLHPDKLMPEEASIIQQALVAVSQDIANGDYEAAIAISQTRLPEAVHLEVVLLSKNDEFHQLLETFNSLIEEIQQNIERLDNQQENRVEIYEQDENSKGGNTILFDGRVDFWSEGWLTDENTNLATECNNVNQLYVQNMDIEGLKRTIDVVTSINRGLPTSLVLAHDQYRQHFALVQTSDRIKNVLSGTPWELSQEGYESDDERNSYWLIFNNGGGQVASVVIVPERFLQTDGRFQAHFIANVSDGVDEADVEDEIECNVQRDAFICFLQSALLEVGGIGRGSTLRDNIGTQAFLVRTTNEGDSIIESRINRVRSMAGR